MTSSTYSAHVKIIQHYHITIHSTYLLLIIIKYNKLTKNFLFQILLACSLTIALVNGQRYSKSIQAQPRVGFSTNIVHNYPGYNDLQAESSINVNFQSQQPLNNRGSAKYISNTPNSNSFSRTSFAGPLKDSSLFNVGYDLSFNENKKQEPRYTNANNNKKFENAEVITGRLKKNEKVRAPSLNVELSPQDFVSNAFLRQKQLNSVSTRHTSTPINVTPKHLSPIHEKYPKYPSQSSTLTYNTQQNIFKDVSKLSRPESIQLSPDFKTSYETSGRWQDITSLKETNNKKLDSISPQGLQEIKHTNVAIQNPSRFNHDFALKNSEAFDFSNAHGEIIFGDNKDSSSAASEQYSQKINSYEIFDQPINKNNNLDSNFNPQQESDLESHLPKYLRGVKPLPVDTSLVKDPGFSKESLKYARVIPIHFDISQMQNDLTPIQNFVAQQNPYVNRQIQSYGYPSQQSYVQHSNLGNSGGLTYENSEPAASQPIFQLYGNPEPMDNKLYSKSGLKYGRDHTNYEEDIYKIVSMRPPPITQNNRY